MYLYLFVSNNSKVPHGTLAVDHSEEAGLKKPKKNRRKKINRNAISANIQSRFLLYIFNYKIFINNNYI